MPIYEYNCKKCDNIFEHLQFRSDDNHAPCPSCGANDTEKLLSTFSSLSSSGHQVVDTSTPPSCGPSGGFS